MKGTFTLVLALLLIVAFGVPKVGTSSNVTNQSEPRLLVGASYMTFWGTGMNGHDWSSGAAVYYPNLGNYSSGDPNVANQQIKMATSHNVSFFLFDYGWANDEQQKLMDDAAIGGLINASERAEVARNFSFCIFYFPNNRVNSSTINETGLIEDFSRINETYFRHSSYLRLDDHYVVILADFYYYLNTTLIAYEGANRNSSFGAVNDLFHALKENYSLYPIPAFWPNHTANASAVLNDARTRWPGLYDAITLWGDNTFLEINKDTTYSEYVSKTENYFSQWKAEATNYDMDFVPFICPGYNNSNYYKMGEADFQSTVTRNVTGWSSIWQLAQQYANTSSYHMILLFTWNDFNEGTSIETTREYGPGYLNAIPEFSSAIGLLLFIAVTLLVVTTYKKRHFKRCTG